MSLDADSDERRVLGEIVRRILSVADPDRIILFGSRARGEAAPGSDYDLLVVAPSNRPRLKRALPLVRELADLPVPKDVVWWTPSEIDEWRVVPSHFIATALREGRVLYERAT